MLSGPIALVIFNPFSILSTLSLVTMILLILSVVGCWYGIESYSERVKTLVNC